MDLQTIITAIAGFLGAGSLTMLFKRQASLERDQSKLRESLPQTYVAKTDYKDDIKELKEGLRDVLSELRSKVDRHE